MKYHLQKNMNYLIILNFYKWKFIICNKTFLFKKSFLNARRLNLIPSYVSISFNIKDRYIFIYCDEGRLIRPLLYFS